VSTYDALRQFERLLNIIDNPQENLNNGAAFGHVNHRIAQCLIQIGDRPRAFHYMEVANFFDHNLVKEKLHLLASLCDFRIPKILEDNAKKYDPDVIRDIWACHELAKDCYMQMIKDERPYVSLGFVLSQLFRVHPYNIFGMHLCHGKDGNTSNKEILEVKDVWNYRLSDALADGNTIVLSYSQAEYQCKMENDKSMLCPSNVIIFHVSAIPGKTMFRIDMMVPPFVFDSDHIRPREGDTPIYRSIVLPAEDYVYDFSQNTETLLKCARSLDKDKRYVEAMLGYHYAYVSLVPKMKSISPSERGNCAVAASLLGSCFLEMDMMDVAEYYLKIGADCNYQNGEYINCLANNKDVRALDVIQQYLLRDAVISGLTLETSQAFLHRRMAYVLIDWGMIDKAKQLLESLLKDPLCHDFAESELRYLKANGK